MKELALALVCIVALFSGNPNIALVGLLAYMVVAVLD